MRSARRAASLIEIVVALAVFGLITGLIGGVFVLSHRYTRVSQQVSRAQREAARCLQAFYTEMTRGHSKTFKPVPAANEVWFLSSLPLDGQSGLGEFSSGGEILWQKWVGMWCESDGFVYRSEIALVGGASPFDEVALGTEPSLLTAFSLLPSKRRVASAIKAFQVSVDERIVTVELDSETTNAGNPPTRYHLASSFLVP